MPNHIASYTTPINWHWTGRPCASSKPTNSPSLAVNPPRSKPTGAQIPQPGHKRKTNDDRRDQFSGRPGGSTGTSHARRCVSREGTARRPRVPPIDYRDGLLPCLTNPRQTDINRYIQRRYEHPRHTGRDRSEQVVAIDWNEWSQSSECALTLSAEAFLLRRNQTFWPLQ